MPLLLGAVLTGCGGGDEPQGLDATAPADTTADDAVDDVEDDPEPTGETPAEVDPTEEPTPQDEPGTGLAGGQTHTFDDIGLTINEPDEVPEDAAFALDMYVTFAREWRWSLQEVEISDELQGIGSPTDLRRLERSIDYQEENGVRYGGEMVIDLEFAARSEHEVIFNGCLDVTDYYWADDDGRNPVRGESGNHTASAVVTVANNSGIWLVSEDADLEEPC
jgi:hypothetical protein